MKVGMCYGLNVKLNNEHNAYQKIMFKRLSSVTIKNQSEQPSEEDELDPTSRLDSTCLIFVQNVALKFHFSLKRITYKQQSAC